MTFSLATQLHAMQGTCDTNASCFAFSCVDLHRSVCYMLASPHKTGCAIQAGRSKLRDVATNSLHLLPRAGGQSCVPARPTGTRLPEPRAELWVVGSLRVPQELSQQMVRMKRGEQN